MTYVIYALCGVSLLQCVGLVVLLKRRRDVDLARVDARLAQFGEALALLTDTAQAGFATLAGELERGGTRQTKPVSRAATSKRIAHAAKQGRSIQAIAADERVSESEVRLHLGFIDEPPAPPARVAAAPKAAAPRPAPVTPAATAGVAKAVSAAAKPRGGARVPAVASVAVVHDAAVKATSRRRGNVLDLGA